MLQRLPRPLVILAFVAALVLVFALPALAQSDPLPPEVSDEGPTTAAVLGALGTFGLVVKAAIAAVKKAAPAVTGLWTMLVATVFGTIIAGAFDFQAAAALAEQYELGGVVGSVPSGAFGWIISGFAIAAASGFFAELAGTSGPKSIPPRVVEVDQDGNPL